MILWLVIALELIYFYKKMLLNVPVFLALSIFLQFLKMAPAPNFGVFLDLANPYFTEVDFRNYFQGWI